MYLNNYIVINTDYLWFIVVEKEEKVESQTKDAEPIKVTNRKENCNNTSQPKPQVSERPQVKPKNRERDERKGKINFIFFFQDKYKI